MRFMLALALAGLLVAGCKDASQPLEPTGTHLLAAAGQAAVHRPLEDFLASSRNCPVAWTDPAQPEFGAVIDFWDFFASRARAGIFPESMGAATYSGSVRERPLRDGTAEVTVNLRVRDAFTGARLCAEDSCFGPAVFGYTSIEVIQGNPPVLGDGHFSITYINTAPGAPLPDFCDVIFSEENEWQVTKIQVTASANGPLRATFGVPEGTPGRLNLVVVERDLVSADRYVSKANINLRPVGR